MKNATRHEITDMIRELNVIARELEAISAGITREFKGVGSIYCANGLEDLSHQYRHWAKKLNKIK